MGTGIIPGILLCGKEMIGSRRGWYTITWVSSRWAGAQLGGNFGDIFGIPIQDHVLYPVFMHRLISQSCTFNGIFIL